MNDTLENFLLWTFSFAAFFLIAACVGLMLTK